MNNITDLLARYKDDSDYVSNEPVSYIYLVNRPDFQLGAEIFERNIFFELCPINAEADEWDRVGEIIVECDWATEPTMFPDWAKSAIREFKKAMRNVFPHLS